MGGLGGIGAFAGGFAKSFAASRENRRLRDLDLMREQQRAEHEQRMQEQFQTQQDFRVKQQAAVEQYRAGQAELQQKQLQLQQKRLDVDVAGGLAKAFDPKIAKPQRVFMLKQMMKTLEIDPKSQQAKDFMQMATSLDDEALKETRSSLMTLLPDATPGQITAFTKSIVNGDLQMKDALEQFDKSRKAKQLQADLGGGGGGVPTTKVQSSRITDPNAMAQQPGMGAQQPGGNMPIPGMAQPGAPGEPTAGGANAQQIRDRAAVLFSHGFTTEGNAQAALARDLEAGKNIQLKEVVGPDKKNIWVPENQAAGMEAPSARPVKTPEEERLSEAATQSVKQDYARMEPWLKDADMARASGPVLQQLKIANQSAKFTTGSFSNVRENITKWAELFGATKLAQDVTGMDLGDPAIAETIKSGSAMLGTMMADRMGRATNMQFGYMQDALPGLMKTKRGNDIIIELMEKTNQRALEIEHKLDEYKDRYQGDLRPPGKPSFFEEADKIRRKPLFGQELEKEIKAEGAKGNALDVTKLWEKAQGNERITIGAGTENEEKYDITGKFEFKDDKGKVTGSVPTIRLKDGKSYPYVTSPEEGAKLPPGTEAVRLDKLHGAVMWTRGQD